MQTVLPPHSQMSNLNNREIECRFLEIDQEVLGSKLLGLGALDRGESVLFETIFYDPELKWRDEQKYVRLRRTGDQTVLTYKSHERHTVDGSLEIEFGIDGHEKAEAFLEKIGLRAFRRQEKRRHTFELGQVTFDIDTWPRIPAYVELEGPSEAALRAAAMSLGLDWTKAEFHNARWVIENIYRIPVGNMKWFTFDKFE